MNSGSIRPNLIGGAWEPGEQTSLDLNPSDLDDVIGEFAQASDAQVDRAVACARAAAPGWATGSAQHKAEVLDRIASGIAERREDVARLLAREEGKTLAEARGEVARAVGSFKFYAQEALRVPGERLPAIRAGIDVEVTREPVGVVGVIAPWNFPIAIPAWKIAPALAYGNAVVFKPADLVPATAWALAEIIHASGLPAGCFNLVMGAGRSVGQRIVDHPDVDAISFTGSVAVGRRVLSAAVARGARVQVEMGGKNPLVVLADADLERAVDCTIQGAFFSTGQRCTATSRVIVDKRVHRAFRDRLLARMTELRVGHALDPASDIGPAVDRSQLETDLRYVAIGQAEGARLLVGGQPLEREHRGHYLSPALFDECDNAMRICREEIFGPVAALIVVDGYEQALAVANDTEFGLSAGICTGSLKFATHFKRHARAGLVMVNAPTAGVDYHAPFGGVKSSSHGAREQGRYAVDFYTTVKTAYTAWEFG